MKTNFVTEPLASPTVIVSSCPCGNLEEDTYIYYY